jgi:hypothetical protein
MKKLLILILVPFLFSCGKDDGTETKNENKSVPTVEYLCSTIMWAYAPEGGIKQGEEYTNFGFQRIDGIQYCTAGKYWIFTLEGSTLTLRERDHYLNNIVEGGETKVLSVYKLIGDDGKKYLLINDKRYIATIGDGIDI